jgi:hypothetical protein
MAGGQRHDPHASRARRVARAEVSARQGAARGALAAAGGALLTVAAAALLAPRLLLAVVGPDPIPQVLATCSTLTAALAGALLGRSGVRIRGTARQRFTRLALRTGLAYLGVVTLVVAAVSVAAQGPSALVFPFLLLTNGLGLALLLAPWAALPVVATAAVLEGWTRQPTRLVQG